MMKKENFPGPVNLGHPSEISIRELAKEIINLTYLKSEITTFFIKWKILSKENQIF